jgi:hypothetical protein
MLLISNTHFYLKYFIRLLPALSFWLLSSLYHLKFSLFLVNPLETTWGVIKLKNYAPQTGYFLLILFAFYLTWYSYRGVYAKKGLLYWFIWILLVFLINQFLLATPIENIHFIQYALLSSLLLWCFNTAEINTDYLLPKVLFWTTFAGILDEISQYLWITASYSHYIDFNDFLLNMMGAIAGLLFYTGFRPVKTAKLSMLKILKSLETGLSFTLILLLVTILALEPGPGLELERKSGMLGSWQPAFNGGNYYVLTPIEGSFLLLLIAVISLILVKNTDVKM